MGELLALSANTPTDLRFSFHGLARRGGATGDHGDGWGLASFDPDGRGVRLFREDAPAAFSPIDHIRKATQGVVALENCHPFHRRWRGNDWVFAHNGDLRKPLPPAPGFPPEGNTDSEAAFCWILAELERRGVDPQDGPQLFEALLQSADALAAQGVFNALLANGTWLFAYSSTRLHCITRRAPFQRATLADDDLTLDFAQLTNPDDVVTILSTEPLTRDACWQQLPPGEAVLLRHGEVVLCRLGTLPTEAFSG